MKTCMGIEKQIKDRYGKDVKKKSLNARWLIYAWAKKKISHLIADEYEEEIRKIVNTLDI